MTNFTSQFKVSSCCVQSGNQVDYPYAGLNSGLHEATPDSDYASTSESSPPHLPFSNLSTRKAIRKFKSKRESQSGSQKKGHLQSRIKRRPGAPHNTNQYLSKEFAAGCSGFFGTGSMIGVVTAVDLSRAEQELLNREGKLDLEANSTAAAAAATSIPNPYYHTLNRGDEVRGEDIN